MIKFPILVFGLVLVTAATVSHASGAQDLDVQARAFSEQAARIRADLAGDDKYSEIGASDRNTVLGLLDRMESLLTSTGSVEAMDNQQKLALINDQERINTILTGAREDSRLICSRVQITGSHRRQNLCITVAERERRRQESNEQLNRQQMMTPSCATVPRPLGC